MTNQIITSGTTIKDALENTHTFYPLLMKDKDILLELLPKVDTNLIVTNMLNVNEDSTFNDEAYEAMLGLIRLALRQPDESTESIEQWLDVRTAKVAMRTLLDLPV